MLLAPERVVVLDDSAYAILSQIDGARTVATIAEELAAEYNAPVDTIAEDVDAFLASLRTKGLISV